MSDYAAERFRSRSSWFTGQLRQAFTGTVANASYAQVGSSCISEQRAIEIIASGKPDTPFMAFGDRVVMEAHMPDGYAPFGAMDQQVVKSCLSACAFAYVALALAAVDANAQDRAAAPPVARLRPSP
jgi:hypothetical protein